MSVRHVRTLSPTSSSPLQVLTSAGQGIFRGVRLFYRRFLAPRGQKLNKTLKPCYRGSVYFRFWLSLEVNFTGFYRRRIATKNRVSTLQGLNTSVSRCYKCSTLQGFAFTWSQLNRSSPFQLVAVTHAQLYMGLHWQGCNFTVVTNVKLYRGYLESGSLPEAHLFRGPVLKVFIFTWAHRYRWSSLHGLTFSRNHFLMGSAQPYFGSYLNGLTVTDDHCYKIHRYRGSPVQGLTSSRVSFTGGYLYRCSLLQEVAVTETRIFRSLPLQGLTSWKVCLYRNSPFQRFTFKGTLFFRGTPLQKLTFPEVYLYRDSLFQRYTFTETHLFRGLPLQGLSFSEVHLYRNSPFQRFTLAGTLFFIGLSLRELTFWRVHRYTS